jgi:spermidine synthase
MTKPDSPAFEELDVQPTSMGELVLRRRRALSRDIDVFEVLLDGEFLMSSLVHESEDALARLALAELGGRESDVLVGGLGLGYTARAALDAAGTRRVRVVEASEHVLGWFRRGLVPLADGLGRDPRCELVHGDFFAPFLPGTEGSGEPPAHALGPAGGNGPGAAGPDWDAILVDIDHTPRVLLHPDHAPFYELEGLTRVRGALRPEGVFALWSAEPEEAAFLETLREAFGNGRAEEVTFLDPLLDQDITNTIYLARA